MEEDKKSFLMFTEWAPFFESATDEQAGDLIKGIFAYVKGEEPELKPATLPAYAFIVSQIDKNFEKWEEAKRQKQEAGRLGGLAKASRAKQNLAEPSTAKQSLAEPSRTKQNLAEPSINVNVNVNDNVSPNGDIKENTKEKATKSRVFVPPTLEEVEAEIQAKGHHVDALEFFNYYDSQAWKKANGQKVSNWKGCLVTWDRKNRQNETPQTQTQNNVTDWDKIAKEVEQLGYFDNGNNHANVFAGIPATVREDVGG